MRLVLCAQDGARGAAAERLARAGVRSARPVSVGRGAHAAGVHVGASLDVKRERVQRVCQWSRDRGTHWQN